MGGEKGHVHKPKFTVPCQVCIFLGHRPHYALHPWARENRLGDTERRHLECSGFQLTGRLEMGAMGGVVDGGGVKDL